MPNLRIKIKTVKRRLLPGISITTFKKQLPNKKQLIETNKPNLETISFNTTTVWDEQVESYLLIKIVFSEIKKNNTNYSSYSSSLHSN